MRKLGITVGVLATLVAIYAVLGYALVPRLVQRQLVAQLEARLGCPAQVQGVSFDPFRFIAELHGVTVCAGGGNGISGSNSPLAAKAVRLDFDPFSSGFGRGWVFGGLEVEGLALSLERDAKGRWNVAELLERVQGAPTPDKPEKGAETKDASSPPVNLRRVALKGASIAVIDRTQQPVASAKLEPIDIEAANLGTAGEAQVTLEAKLEGGGTMHVTGSVNPSPLSASGEARLSGLPLGVPYSFFASATNLVPPAGRIDLALQYRYGKDGFSASAIQAAASDLSLQLRGDKEPLGAVKVLRLGNGRFDGAKRTVEFAELTLEQGTLVFRKTPVGKDQGGLNWGRIMRDGGVRGKGHDLPPSHSAAEPERAEKKSSGTPFDVRFAKVRVNAIDLAWGDAARPRPYDLRLGGLTGEGVMHLALGGEKTQVLLTDTSLAAASVALAAAGGEPVHLERVALEQAKLDVAQSRLSLGRFSIGGGRVQVVREEDGGLALARVFASTGPSEGPPLRIAVEEARVEPIDIQYEDRTYKPTLTYPLTANINLRGYGGEKPMAFELAARAGEGTLNVGGTLTQAFDRFDADVRANGITLKPLQPLVGQVARVTIATGTASMQMKVAWRGGTGGWIGAEGDGTIDGLRLNDEAGKEQVVAWKRLAANAVRYRSDPAGAEIDRVVIDALQTRIEIGKGRQLNLARLIRERPATRSEERKEQVEAGVKPSVVKGTLPIHVGTVQIRDGRVEYADRTLIVPFDTEVTALGGFITGLSNDPARHAQVNLGGRIDPFGEAKVEGSLAAFAPRSFLDLRVNFANVPLPKLSPYSATFLGRTMAEGRLWLDLGYQIKDGHLAGNNRVSIRDLKLGEKVNAPGALDLPLDLAVALLTDANGVFTTDLQVSGDVDDPKFDVASLVKAALGNVVRRVVSAPFRALGRLFGAGGDSQEQVAIEFEPGSARLSPPQEEKLVSIAGALAQRPQLTLGVAAPYDVDRDLAALREQSARVQLARTLGRNEQPESVDIESDRSMAALRSLLGASASNTGAGSGVSASARAPAPESKASPGEAQSKASPGEALLHQLAQAQPVDESGARALAGARAEAITQFLSDKGVAAGRLTRGKLVEQKSKDKPIAAPLELGVSKG